MVAASPGGIGVLSISERSLGGAKSSAASFVYGALDESCGIVSFERSGCREERARKASQVTTNCNLRRRRSSIHAGVRYLFALGWPTTLINVKFLSPDGGFADFAVRPIA